MPRPTPPPPQRVGLPFKLAYGYFRELLAANDRVLEVIAEFEDKLGGEHPFNLKEVRTRVETATSAAFVIVKNLNLVSDGKYPALYDALERIDRNVHAALGDVRRSEGGPLVVPLSSTLREAVHALGAKMANLGEMRNRLGLRVPDGFVVSADGFDQLIAHNGLADRIAARLAVVPEDEAELERASAAVQEMILNAEIPHTLQEALDGAVADLCERAGGPVRVAVRSSALDEDGIASFAGQYRTILNVAPGDVAARYLEVVASLYGPGAIAYRVQRGVGDEGTRMAVGCIELVDAVAAGVMFTRDPAHRDDRVALIDAVPGQGVMLVGGEGATDHFVVSHGPAPRVLERVLAEKQRMRVPAPGGGLVEVDVPTPGRAAACVDERHLLALGQTARELEKHFGAPQDVEWAVDRSGALFFLQSRPLLFPDAVDTAGAAPLEFDGHELLVREGTTACPGVGAGVVMRVHDKSELEGVPPGAVLVARHSSPAFLRVMRRIASIVTEVGSATGHMAIIAREFGVPTILGAPSAAALPSGAEVTVDATRARVYRGRVEALLARQRSRSAPMKGTPVMATLERVAPFLTPLRLIDPAAPAFAAEHCESLHDIARFAHEKSFSEMIHIGDDVKRADEAHAAKLRAHLPIDVYILDLGGGLAPGAAQRDEVTVEDLAGVPLKAFVSGLSDPLIQWDRPRPVSLGGFMSVLGQSMLSPPPDKHSLGRRSFAIASDSYLNFSTRAGYHFSTVDSYCGRSINKNYIQFRFVGGAAAEDRRARRARFVAEVLSRFGFATQVKGDIVAARLQKYDREQIEQTLRTVGRLTTCTRQLDMLMDKDASVNAFVEAFCSGQYEFFT
jgi:pyruvate,water dikinase